MNIPKYLNSNKILFIKGNLCIVGFDTVLFLANWEQKFQTSCFCLSISFLKLGNVEKLFCSLFSKLTDDLKQKG